MYVRMARDGAGVLKMARWVEIPYKCRCMSAEATIHVEERRVAEDILEFIGRVQAAVGEDHRKRSPFCLSSTNGICEDFGRRRRDREGRRGNVMRDTIFVVVVAVLAIVMLSVIGVLMYGLFDSRVEGVRDPGAGVPDHRRMLRRDSRRSDSWRRERTMSPSYSRLSEALARPPIGSKPRKPTSVPPMTLLAVLTRAQDRLRGRPRRRTLRERLSDWLWERGWL